MKCQGIALPHDSFSFSDLIRVSAYMPCPKSRAPEVSIHTSKSSAFGFLIGLWHRSAGSTIYWIQTAQQHESSWHLQLQVVLGLGRQVLSSLLLS